MMMKRRTKTRRTEGARGEDGRVEMCVKHPREGAVETVLSRVFF